MSIQSLTMRVWKTKKGRSLLTHRGPDTYYVNLAECTEEELLALGEAIHEATEPKPPTEEEKEE